ncbi:hypothetical protein D3C81_1822380 [compost metagenome]
MDVGHAFADGLDHPGGFNAHAVRHRDRVSTIAEVGVGIVQANCYVAKTNLARTGIADFDVLVT